ncbi:hypothetical protein Btru_008418 [Bulinus truncatus]|nr:hypothetical protein Btru_008418 [Bulinus truncatus]
MDARMDITVTVAITLCKSHLLLIFTVCSSRCLSSLCYSDGECISCPKGFYGPQCTTACDENCITDFTLSLYTACDENCMNNICESKTGKCRRCTAGTAGPDCHNRCANCAGDGGCDQQTKECSQGCNTGFKGLTCSEAIEADSPKIFLFAMVSFALLASVVSTICRLRYWFGKKPNYCDRSLPCGTVPSLSVLTFCSYQTQASKTCASRSRTGPSCRFVCRCVDNRCLSSAACQPGVKCVSGYFGFGCQYVDVTARLGQSFPSLTDYNEKTCMLEPLTQSVIIKVQPNRFTFAHLVYLNQSYLDKLQDFKIALLYNSSEVPCVNRSLIFLQNNTLEVHCTKTAHIDTVLVKGGTVPLLCNVYVSGGRNMAVDSVVSASSSFNTFRPDRIVDGMYTTIETEFNSEICFHTGYDKAPEANVTFHTSILVDRVRIYNRPGINSKRLNYFQLIFYNSSNKILYSHSDRQGDKVLYTVFYNYSSPVKMLQLYPTNRQSGDVYRFINICEIEAYGDCYTGSGLTCGTQCDSECAVFGCNVQGMCRDCPTNYTGHQCEIKCPENCLISNDSLVCNPFTLRCIHGCVDGFYGDSCSLECSANCMQRSPCERDTGNCTHGCMTGYFGPTCSLACNWTCKSYTGCQQMLGKCLDGCNSGFHGEYCNHMCSENCLPQNHCNDTTGACYDTCMTGYYGDQCTTECFENCLSCDRDTGTCNSLCKIGFQGLNCTEECSSNCVQSLCDSETGNCQLGCFRGFYGKNCSDVCNETCDPLYGCEMNTGECVVFCPPGYHGVKCEKECSRNCRIPGDCNNKTGHCNHGCQRGYYLDNCTASCQERCGLNVMCTEKGDCMSICIRGDVGYDCLVECHPNCNGSCNAKTKLCENGCLTGYYGPTCGKECPDVCRNHTCDDSNGHCHDCVKGKQGPQCSIDCDTECLNRECDRSTGQCIACNPGSAGLYCEVRCENCAGAGSCDQLTKVCVGGCVTGYKGETCNEDEHYESSKTFTVASLLFATVVLVLSLVFHAIRRMDWLRGGDEE